jgi:uncharacterized coiled-coil DUF342 family protein
MSASRPPNSSGNSLTPAPKRRVEAFAQRKLQDELKRLTDEHQAICKKYTAAAGDRDTAVACTQQMADEIEQLRNRAEAAEALMEEAHQQIEALRAESVELTRAVASAQEEIAAYAQLVQEQERDLIAERTQHVETQSERTSASRKLGELGISLAPYRRTLRRPVQR